VFDKVINNAGIEIGIALQDRVLVKY
jgi:hypothetical protein